jgi:hypothetical protein
VANQIVEFNGLGHLLATLRAQEQKGEEDEVVGSIGYTMPYTVYVHERLDVYHKPGTMAKFVEYPARELTNNGALAAKMRSVYKNTKSMLRAVTSGVLMIFNWSQELVPVDTGALKASGYMEVEKV